MKSSVNTGVSTLKTEQLIPYQLNNRNHSSDQVELIAKSIKEFGFNQPIVIDETNTILVGHGRLLAAQALGLKECPIIQLKNLSESQKKAYRILDNKLQNDSTWSFDNLGLELGFLEDNDFDLQAWGLDKLKELFPEIEIEVVDDEFEPKEQREIYLKLGDLIELGTHKIYCEDFQHCPKVTNVNLWITDPPYGVSYQGKTEEALELDNDDLDEEETEKLWVNATNFALSCLNEGASCYASVPAGRLHFTFLKIWIEAEIYRQQLIWNKDSMVLGHSDYHFKHEPILYGWKPGAAHYFTENRTKTSVLDFTRPKSSREHPTMKPLELWAELIKNSTQKGDLVLDTFLGSGTTLIACEELGRKCCGMEINPQYCQVIIDRYKHYCECNSKRFECKINGEVFNGRT